MIQYSENGIESWMYIKQLRHSSNVIAAIHMQICRDTCLKLNLNKCETEEFFNIKSTSTRTFAIFDCQQQCTICVEKSCRHLQCFEWSEQYEIAWRVMQWQENRAHRVQSIDCMYQSFDAPCFLYFDSNHGWLTTHGMHNSQTLDTV